MQSKPAKALDLHWWSPATRNLIFAPPRCGRCWSCSSATAGAGNSEGRPGQDRGHVVGHAAGWRARFRPESLRYWFQQVDGSKGLKPRQL